MKNNSIILALACTFLAYLAYPFFSTQQTDEAALITSNDANMLNNVAAVITNDELEPATPIDDDETFYDSKQQAIDEDKINIQELQDWTTSHKSSIFKIINKSLPPSLIAKFKKIIPEHNDFLESPTLNQDPFTDKFWAYDMEFTLRDLIVQHELSYDFEILSITCKQLICEVIGIDKTALVWRKIHQSLITNYQVVDLLERADTRKIALAENGQIHIYYQYKFKQNLNW